MTWKRLLETKQIEHHTTNRKELDELRSMVERNLHDARVEALSPDTRFALAYNACLLLAKMVLACAGYRTKGHGAHRSTFEALGIALGPEAAPLASYLSDCRRKRNQLTYSASGVVSDTEASELLKEAESFLQQTESWIDKHYPDYSRK